MKKEMEKSLRRMLFIVMIPLLIISITALLSGWLYGNARVYIGDDNISSYNIDVFMTVIVFGTGIITLLMGVVSQLILKKK